MQSEVNKESVSALFRKFSTMRIMVIGDVMVDAYLWGKVDRISPEAPVPVVTCTKKETRLGGAANVALNLLSLGAEPVMCSVTGSDETGKLLRKLMEQEGMGEGLMLTDPGRVTTTKTRIISGSQQLLRVDDENTAPLDPVIEKTFIEKITGYLEKTKVDAIIFQDYDKGAITPALIHAVTGLAGRRNIPTLVDPKRRNFASYRSVSLFKPNFKEFAEGMKMEIRRNDTALLAEAGRQYLAASDNRLLLLTLSDLGVFITDGQKYASIPAHKRDIADVSGAGDTVISIAALCLAAGCDPAQTAALANLAGGLVCEKVGVVPVEREIFLKEASGIETSW